MSTFSRILKTKTIEESMAEAKGIGPGFDFLRIFLAVAILCWHSVFITHGRQYFDWTHSPVYPPVLIMVPAFFCLSGFLVTGSALRVRSVKTFLIFRSLRIFPALIVEVSLCALLIGSATTTLPLAEYFSSRKFFSYFGNIIGFVRFELPGVFSNNPLPKIVNGSLWTLQPEFYCYLLMAVAMATKLVYHKKYYTVAFAALTGALIVADAIYHIGAPIPLAPWPMIVYCFFVGIFFFHWRDRIPTSIPIFCACFAAAYYTIGIPGLGYISAWPVCYAICCVGMQRIHLPKILTSGDYSYGIYLLGYPIQQLLIFLFPKIPHWTLLFIIALVLSGLVATISWHFIEKPALRLKGLFLGKNPRVPQAAALPSLPTSK